MPEELGFGDISASFQGGSIESGDTSVSTGGGTSGAVASGPSVQPAKQGQFGLVLAITGATLGLAAIGGILIATREKKPKDSS